MHEFSRPANYNYGWLKEACVLLLQYVFPIDIIPSPLFPFYLMLKQSKGKEKYTFSFFVSNPLTSCIHFYKEVCDG